MDFIVKCQSSYLVKIDDNNNPIWDTNIKKAAKYNVSTAQRKKDTLVSVGYYSEAVFLEKANG